MEIANWQEPDNFEELDDVILQKIVGGGDAVLITYDDAASLQTRIDCAEAQGLGEIFASTLEEDAYEDFLTLHGVLP